VERDNDDEKDEEEINDDEDSEEEKEEKEEGKENEENDDNNSNKKKNKESEGKKEKNIKFKQEPYPVDSRSVRNKIKHDARRADRRQKMSIHNVNKLTRDRKKIKLRDAREEIKNYV
jgi:hypothetical protein